MEDGFTYPTGGFHHFANFGVNQHNQYGTQSQPAPNLQKALLGMIFFLQCFILYQDEEKEEFWKTFITPGQLSEHLTDVFEVCMQY